MGNLKGDFLLKVGPISESLSFMILKKKQLNIISQRFNDPQSCLQYENNLETFSSKDLAPNYANCWVTNGKSISLTVPNSFTWSESRIYFQILKFPVSVCMALMDNQWIHFIYAGEVLILTKKTWGKTNFYSKSESK